MTDNPSEQKEQTQSRSELSWWELHRVPHWREQHGRAPRPPATANFDEHGKPRKARNTTFEMLKIPVGSLLTAIFKGKELRFETANNENMIKDLQTGETMTISAMANKYMGGSNNGFVCFSYNGKKLSDIRAEMDDGYLPYLRTIPKQVEKD